MLLYSKRHKGYDNVKSNICRVEKSEKELFLKLYNEGITVIKISRSTKRSVSSVMRALKSQGVIFQRGFDISKMEPIEKSEKELFLKLYNEGKTVMQISKLTKRSDASIRRSLRIDNVVFQQKFGRKISLSAKEISKICELYEKGFSTVEIAEKFKLKVMCDRTIATILRKNNATIRKSGYSTIIDNIDYFEQINTESRAYIVGLLVADGSVGIYNNKYTIQISLIEEDSYLLEHMIREIGLKIKVKNIDKEEISIEYRKLTKSIRTIPGTNTHNQKRISFISKKIFDDLSRYGIVPNKTFNERFPTNIPDHLMKHFIRGFFDGDGTVYFYRKNKCMKFGFYAQTEFLTDLQKYLVDYICLSNNKIYIKPSISFNSWSKPTDIKAFYEYIYSDATIYMKRKKEKFDKYFLTKTHKPVPR